jgi:hypothetical protein
MWRNPRLQQVAPAASKLPLLTPRTLTATCHMHAHDSELSVNGRSCLRHGSVPSTSNRRVGQGGVHARFHLVRGSYLRSERPARS